MDDALAALERSGSIYFLKTLPQTAIPALTTRADACLVIPIQFVREHAEKVEEWVTLRIQSSNGKSSRPWAVRFNIIMRSNEVHCVRFAKGWKDFAAGNGLRMGDSLIFLLKEGVRSEFEVHVFRGSEGSPYFPDLCASSTAMDDNDEEEHNAEIFVPNSAFPGFRKLMTVSYIGRSTGTGSGQLELPRPFVRTHGEHLQASVQLQGVHDDSPIYVIPCSRSRHVEDGHLRISFKTTAWGRFVKANRLKVGQELQFLLTADSYFKVRVI